MKKKLIVGLISLILLTSCQGKRIYFEEFHDKALEAKEKEFPYNAFTVSYLDKKPDEEDVNIFAKYVLEDKTWNIITPGIDENIEQYMEYFFAYEAYEIPDDEAVDDHVVYYVNPLKAQIEKGPNVVTKGEVEESSFEVFKITFNEYGYITYFEYENRMTFVEGRNTTNRIESITMDFEYSIN